MQVLSWKISVSPLDLPYPQNRNRVTFTAHSCRLPLKVKSEATEQLLDELLKDFPQSSLRARAGILLRCGFVLQMC